MTSESWFAIDSDDSPLRNRKITTVVLIIILQLRRQTEWQIILRNHYQQSGMAGEAYPATLHSFPAANGEADWLLQVASCDALKVTPID